MRFLALAGSVVVLGACTAKESKPADTSAPPPAALSPYIPGIWDVTVKPEGKDSVVATYVLNTTDSAEWLFAFPGGKPVAIHLTGIHGDTAMAESDIFESSVRPGMKAKSSQKVWVNDDGRLVGKAVVHYETTGPDTVRIFDTEGKRKQ